MLAFLDQFRRRPATHSATLVAGDPAEGPQNGARRVPASFASAPAQRVAATEPIAAEEPPKTDGAARGVPFRWPWCRLSGGPSGRAWRPDAHVHPGRRWRPGPDPL